MGARRAAQMALGRESAGVTAAPRRAGVVGDARGARTRAQRCSGARRDERRLARVDHGAHRRSAATREWHGGHGRRCSATELTIGFRQFAVDIGGDEWIDEAAIRH